MSEILQQRIEFVQAGRNTTHAQIEAKRNLREELETEMEKYLARGGKVESLKGTEFVPRPPRKQTKIKGHASKSQVVKIRNWVNAVSTTPTRREQLSRTTGIHINRVRSLLAPPATHGARMTQSEFSLFMEAIPFIERREAQGKAA